MGHILLGAIWNDFLGVYDFYGFERIPKAGVTSFFGGRGWWEGARRRWKAGPSETTCTVMNPIMGLHAALMEAGLEIFHEFFIYIHIRIYIYI